MAEFKHNLNDRVKLIESAEEGTITARAEYLHTQNNYLIRYCAGDGRQVESWWGESDITAA